MLKGPNARYWFVAIIIILGVVVWTTTATKQRQQTAMVQATPSPAVPLKTTPTYPRPLLVEKTRADGSKTMVYQSPPNLQAVPLNRNVMNYIDQQAGGDSRKKRALSQHARGLQRIIDQAESRDVIVNEGTKALFCLDEVLGVQEAYKHNHQLKILTFDNSEKMDRLMQWNQSWNGKFRKAPFDLFSTEKELCEP